MANEYSSLDSLVKVIEHYDPKKHVGWELNSDDIVIDRDQAKYALEELAALRAENAALAADLKCVTELLEGSGEDNTALRKRLKTCEDALREIRRLTACDCPADYTRRGKHVPKTGWCDTDIPAEANTALRGEGE